MCHFPVLNFQGNGEGCGLGETRSLQYIYPQHLTTEGGLKNEMRNIPCLMRQGLKKERMGEDILYHRDVHLFADEPYVLFFQPVRLAQIYILLFWISRCWPIEPNVVSPPPYL